MTRKEFAGSIFLSLIAFVTALVAGCSSAPDAETEPSPEWPPPIE